MSKEIIRFDQAMFESKLDAMVREKVERIVNAMPDASGERLPDMLNAPDEAWIPSMPGRLRRVVLSRIIHSPVLRKLSCSCAAWYLTRHS